MTAKKSILIICDSDLSREPRVIRQIVALKDLYNVYTLGAKPSSFEAVPHYSKDRVSETPAHWKYPWLVRKFISAALRLYHKFSHLYPTIYFDWEYWNTEKKQLGKELQQQHFDLIIAHHWNALPLAVAIGGGTSKLIFNAHDYYTREFEDNAAWVAHQKKFVEYIMKKYLPKFQLIFAAWAKLKDDFQQIYGVPSIIINNATEFNDLTPVWKSKSDTSVRIIHHGIANSNREIEKMIEVMDYLDERFSLDLMVLPSPHEAEYFVMLKERASKNPKVRFIEPVPTREIAKRINSYDIGLFLLPPNGVNPTYTLPNKSFEFIQGRLASLVSPNIEMKTLVEKYNLGWVSDDFEPASVARKIAAVTADEINKKKQNAHKHAFELSAEQTYIKIRAAVEKLLTTDSVAGQQIDWASLQEPVTLTN